MIDYIKNQMKLPLSQAQGTWKLLRSLIELGVEFTQNSEVLILKDVVTLVEHRANVFFAPARLKTRSPCRQSCGKLSQYNFLSKCKNKN
jgi:hypothetical protein